jgi:prepilin-type N-terminal cleavage/methylation domain-containing protein
MKTSRHSSRSGAAGFTLVEVMISMAVLTLVLAMCMSTFVFCLKMMYRDMARLQTNANLRSFTSQITTETVDATNYYLFPLYTTLDGNINLATAPIDTSGWVTDTYGSSLAYGDCLVLVTLADESSGSSNIRQIKIYYRQVTSSNVDGPIRYWAGTDYGTAGTTQTLTQLLNAVNLNATPAYPGSKILTQTARGRKKPTWTSSNLVYYPIFCTESSTATATNQNVSINVEFINGTTVNNLLSSSSFNYTISPRK